MAIADPAAVRLMRVEGPWSRDWDMLTGALRYVTAGFLVGPEGAESSMHEYNKKNGAQVPSDAVPLPSASNPDLSTLPLAGWSVTPPYIPCRLCRTDIDPAQSLLASPAALYITPRLR